MPERPLLAVVHRPSSQPWTEIVRAAHDLCRLCWVVDSRDAGVDESARWLRRAGAVVDMAGLSVEQAAAAVGRLEPDGVTAFLDADLPLAAGIAERLDLCGHRPAATQVLNDKLLQSRALATAGVPVARFAAVDRGMRASELLRAGEEVGYPAILKPRRGAGSRGVVAVAGADQLLHSVAAADSDSVVVAHLADGAAAQPPIGDFYAVDTAVDPHGAHHFGVTGYFVVAEPFRLTGGFFPADLDGARSAQLCHLAERAVSALGGGCGWYRTEIKAAAGGDHVVEVNGRPTGLTAPAARLVGLSLLRQAMAVALGRSPAPAGPPAAGGMGYCWFALAPVGASRLAGVDGVAALRALPGVDSVEVLRTPGSAVDWREGAASRVARVVGLAGGREELVRRYRDCAGGLALSFE